MNSLENIVGTANTADPVAIMANVMNYLSVSMYQGSFKQCHQTALTAMNTIYDAVSKTQSVAPSRMDVVAFYDNLTFLSSVTDTDDPDYWIYKKQLKQCIHLIDK